jgi:hypothetical protein
LEYEMLNFQTLVIKDVCSMLISLTLTGVEI